MKNENNYSGIEKKRIDSWSDEWYVDKYGILKLREAYDDEMEMITLIPVYSEDKDEYLMVEVKE